MDTVKQAAITPLKSRLARAIVKTLHIQAVTGIAPVGGVQKLRSLENVKDDGVRNVKSREMDNCPTGKNMEDRSPPFDRDDDKDFQARLAFEAIVSGLFASISTIKAAYAQLQHGQSPYDTDAIQAADKMVVSEFRNLYELEKCFLKQQFDPTLEKAILSAEVQEQKGILKVFDITGKQLESKLKLKDSESMVLRNKLGEAKKHNKSIRKKLNQSGQLSALDQLHLSGLTPKHFDTVLQHTVKSVRSFVRLMIDGMKAFGWNIDAVASSIEPDVDYWKADHKCFAIESFVCKEMFSAFHQLNFLLPNESTPEDLDDKRRQLFFQRFTQLKSVNINEYLSENHRSTFAKFCHAKYLALVHPRMEASLFRNLSKRNNVNSGEFPDSPFFVSFAEMARRVWLLHCLAFSFEPEASIFQVGKRCRFSEVYMESVTLQDDGNLLQYNPSVALSVFPGFRIGKTVLQCQVYLSLHPLTLLL